MNKEPIYPAPAGNSNSSMYSYDYCYDNSDKIYYSTGDEEFRKEIVKTTLVKPANDFLVGDIEKEFHITDETILSKLEQMLIQHLSITENRRVTSISLQKPGEEVSAWVNYMKPNEFNPVHDHGGMLSFIWYLDIPEEIREEWKQSKANIGKRGLIEFRSQVVAKQVLCFCPKTNDFFMFNAKHEHQVYPYYSNNTRISLAGNIHGVHYE